MLRPILAMWHEKQGSPESGLLFPVRKNGERKGEARGHQSFADAMRTDLKRCFGLEVWNLDRVRYEPVDRPMTEREAQLLTETERTLPVDFHSWRRAFNQALANAGVNAQTAQALADRSTMAAHER